MKRAAFLLAWTMIAMPAISQYTISGVVVDERGKPLPGANVVLSEINRGSVTSADGAFFIDGVSTGTYNLRVTFVGYKSKRIAITLTADLDLGMIGLTRLTIMGEEVIVTAIRAGSNMPVAYESLDRSAITSRNFGQDVPYLLSSTPSLVITSDAGHGIGYTSMRIRGTDANRINGTYSGGFYGLEVDPVPSIMYRGVWYTGIYPVECLSILSGPELPRVHSVLNQLHHEMCIIAKKVVIHCFIFF